MSVGWKQSILVTATLLLCCCGAWLSDGLLQLHDGPASASGSARSLIAHFCHPNSEGTSGCLASARSPWSEVRLPLPAHPLAVPVAFLAIAYFITLGAWRAFVGEARLKWKQLAWLPIAMIAVGLYTSLFYMTLMASGRAPWCGGCVAVHLINFLLVTTIGLSRRLARQSPGLSEVSLRQVLALAAFCLLLIGTLYSARSQRLSLQDRIADLQPYQRIVDALQQNSGLLMDAYLNEPKHDIPLRPDETDPAAEHQLVIFLDFQCPGCLLTHDFIRGQVMQDFAGKLNVVVRHYPICTQCNPIVPRTIHPDACIAADAAEAARVLGGGPAFERMADLLFANAPYLGTAIGRDMAIQAGIDPDQFLKLLHDPAVQQRVAQDIAQAHALGVNSTPTLFLDGRLVPDICMTSEFWQAIAKRPTTERVSN